MQISSRINFRKPRQKEWGIIKENSLVALNYGGVTDASGSALVFNSTNCYRDALEQVRLLLSQGTATADIQLVEFVPYDYTMQPRV
jgi:hypothetical protein